MIVVGREEDRYGAYGGLRMSDVEGNGLGIDYVIHTLRHAFHFRVKGGERGAVAIE